MITDKIKNEVKGNPIAVFAELKSLRCTHT